VKTKYLSFILFNLVVAFYLSYRYSVLSYLGLLMMIAIHELGHYVFAVIDGGVPEFIISSRGDFGVTYDREWTVLFGAGGMLANFLFLPLFVGMGIMDMGPGWIVLLIIGGSSRDIMNIVKELRKSE